MPRIPKIPKSQHGDIESACRDYVEHKVAAAKFEAAKKTLKNLREWVYNQGKKRGAATCGDFLLTFSFNPHTGVQLPDDLKTRYTVTKPDGRFGVGVVRQGSP